MALTPIRITGFEYGLAAPVILGGGIATTVSSAAGVSIVAAPASRSAYALRFNVAGTASYIQRIETSADYHVGSVYVYFKDSLPSADNIIIRGINDDGDMAIYFESTDSKLYSGKVGVGFCATGYAVVVNTWYRIDYRFYTAATTHTAEWSVAVGDAAGVAQTTYSVASRANNQMTAWRLGVGAITTDTYFDDFILSETSTDYPIGAHTVVGLRPAADGVHNNAANIMEDSAGADIGDGTGGTVNAYIYLDENPWITTADADYVRQTANGAANYAEVAFTSTSQATILGAMVTLQYASASTSANNGATVVVDEDTTVTSVLGTTDVPVDMSYTSAYYASAVLPKPAGGWDAAAVNALRCRMGYSTDALPDPYWLAIIVEMAYVPSTTPTVYNELFMTFES